MGAALFADSRCMVFLLQMIQCQALGLHLSSMSYLISLILLPTSVRYSTFSRYSPSVPEAQDNARMLGISLPRSTIQTLSILPRGEPFQMIA